MNRKPISETVEELKDAFLATKSDDYKNKFNDKSMKQQYVAIMQWKKNAKDLGMATKQLAKVTAANVVNYLKDVQKKLQKVDALTPKEKEKLVAVLDSVKSTIDNFDRKKKEQLLEAYKAEKERLAKEDSELSRKIEDLQNQLA